MLLRSENRIEESLALLLVLAGVILRVLPHPDNFSPVTAIALFSGVALAPALALTVPLLVMIASDLWIGPHSLFFLTWGCFFLVSLLGIGIKDSAGASKIFLGTLAGSVIFFIVTNLGVFFFQNMYAKDFSGLAECYVMALPFFKNTVLGDLFYSGVLFGAFGFAKRYSRKFVPLR